MVVVQDLWSGPSTVAERQEMLREPIPERMAGRALCQADLDLLPEKFCDHIVDAGSGAALTTNS